MSETMMEPTAADVYATAPEPVARNTLAEERQLLAALLSQPTSAPDEVLELPAEHFTGPRHAELWTLLVERARDGLDADVPAVCEAMFHKPGLVDFIRQLAVQGITPITPAELATIAEIITKGHRGRLAEQALLSAWQRLAAGHVDDCLTIMTTADPNVGKIDRSITLTEAWSAALTEAQAGIRIIPTPWKTLNGEYLSGGWRAREVYFLAGAPGAGKTAAMQDITTHAARAGYPCAVFSLEMAAQDLARRTLSTAAAIPMAEVMRPGLDMTAEAYTKANDALDAVGDLIHITDDPDLTIGQLRNQARLNVRRHGCCLILVDYAQLVNAEDPKLNERERIDHVAGQLKAMAKELAVPVVALAQPNRNAALQGRKLEMTDLHGSGALERYGAMVLLLNKIKELDADDNEVDSPYVNFDIAKNRYGKRGTFRLLADLSRQTFTEL